MMMPVVSWEVTVRSTHEVQVRKDSESAERVSPTIWDDLEKLFNTEMRGMKGG